MNKPHSYKIVIFKDQYSVVSDEAEAVIIHAAQLIDTLMQDIADRSKIHDVKKIAVLAALHAAVRLTKLEQAAEEDLLKHKFLIQHIDELLMTLPYSSQSS